MSGSTRAALGVASVLPALAYVAASRVPDAVRSMESLDAVIVGMLILMSVGLAAVLTFVWIAGGLRRPLLYRVACVVALTAFGVVAAPVFWWVHVRKAPSATSAV